MSSQPAFESIVRSALGHCAAWQEVPVTKPEDIWVTDERIWIQLGFEWRERELLGRCADADAITTIRDSVSRGTFVDGLLAFDLPAIGLVVPEAQDSLEVFELTTPEICIEKLVRLLKLISGADDFELKQSYMDACKRQKQAYLDTN
jgi:hypothetical protein